MAFGNAWTQRDKDRLEQILKSNINLKKILIIGGTGFLDIT